jgi:hypothetical protein
MILIFSILSIQLVNALYWFVDRLIIDSDIEATIELFLLSIWRLLSFPIALTI